MLFLKLNYTDVSFDENTLIWRSYTTNKAFFITKQAQLINQKEFFIAVFNAGSEIFVVYVAIQE